ncbi:MAG: response regulator transcription factor [Deltaproteobacteria bacterium]|nr:response regulator transcription factor [Deltaproteobacteria bacterium]
MRCSLLLSDLTMAEMDGLTLIRAARALRPELTCLLLTGLGSNVPPETWLDAGAAGLVAKPIRTEEFLDAVRSALDGPPA